MRELSLRYNRRVLRNVIVIAAFVLACGTPPKPVHPDGKGSGSAGGTVGTGGSQKPTPAGPMKDIGCHVATCAYHPGTSTYFTCQAAGAGTCFHFGAPCTPDGGCMFDAASRSYKTCTTPVEGTCTAWGAACTPASKCMLDVTDNLHKKCDDASNGTCKRYGALCAP